MVEGVVGMAMGTVLGGITDRELSSAAVMGQPMAEEDTIDPEEPEQRPQ